QDVSPLQNKLTEPWLEVRRDIRVYGDASHTIYAFASADLYFPLGFAHKYSTHIVLCHATQFRTQPPILGAANELMKGRPGGLETIAAREAPTADAPTGTAYDSDAEEAAGIAAGIKARLKAGAEASEIAVLYRAHAQSAPIQQALAEAGIPTTVLGGKRFFDMPEVRQAVLALRGASVAPTERGFLPNVRRVLREMGLTDEPPAAGGAQRDGWE